MTLAELIALARTVYRDYSVDGVSASGAHEPEKAAIRGFLESLLTNVDQAVAGAIVSGISFATKAAMDADLAHAAGTGAIVWSDATEANNAIYKKTGASGTGSWTKIVELSDVLSAFAVEAQAAAALAQAWAEQPEDEDVAGAADGSRSAKHYAEKALGYANDAAISAGAALGPAALISGGENIFYLTSAPEYSGVGGGITNNGDGTFTINATVAIVTWNAVGRLAPGKRISLAVRAVTGAVTAADTFIRFKTAGDVTISTNPVSSSPDADGYHSIDNLEVPALAAVVEVWADPATSGDRLEVVFTPAPYTYAARRGGQSQLPITRGPIIEGVPYRFASLNQALQGLPTPNGMVATWQKLIASRGGTASSTVLTALRKVERWLAATGLIEKIVYLNLRCGNQLASALTPFIDRAGFGYDAAPSSFSTWSEANGLVGATVSTGIDPNNAGLNAYGFAVGMYVLNNIADTGNNYAVGNIDGLYGLMPRYADLLLFDAYGGDAGRVAGDIRNSDGAGTFVGDTLGSLAGARCIDGTARVSRRGIVLGSGTALPTVNFSNLPILIDTNPQASGGDWVGGGMWTPDDTLLMDAILHTFNKDIGRAVVAEGVH